MGGPGSGSWIRFDTKTTTDDVKSIDIRWMRKHDLLKTGYTGSFSWSRFGRQTGWIKFRVEETQLVLMYQYRYGNDAWTSIEENVPLDRTPCNYGGKRTWFKCPECGKRVALLYGAGPRFLCRHCYDLPYGSQQEPYMDRMMRKAWKIRERLGTQASLLDPIVIKPKGMHWKTFHHFIREEKKANGAYSKAVETRLGILSNDA